MNYGSKEKVDSDNHLFTMNLFIVLHFTVYVEFLCVLIPKIHPTYYLLLILNTYFSKEIEYYSY